MVLATLDMVVTKHNGLAGLLHRTKRSTNNCIESSSHRSDIFPTNAVQGIKCKQGCYEVVKKVKYAVIKIEDVVVGCRKTNQLPNSEVILDLDADAKNRHRRVCKDNFKAIKANITVLYENGDLLEAKKEEIIIDCVKK